MSTIFVKVTKVPGGVKEVSLNEDATVREAIEAAELDATGYSITVNGDSADLDTELEDEDRVILAQAVKSAN